MSRRAARGTPEQPQSSTATEQRRSREVAPPEARLPTLIDASALIALLGSEPAAGEVAEILEDGAAITALNLAEAVDRLGRRCGLGVQRVRPVIDGLLEDALEVMPVTSVQAWRDAEIRISH